MDLLNDLHGSSLTSSSLEDIEAGVLEFIKTINILSQSPSSLEELSDGIVLMEILSKINSVVFNMNLIVVETGDNWALRHKNITVLVKSLETYYQEVLKMSKFDSERYVDIMEISQNKNHTEVVKLVELVLGVIVQSESKQEFILAITLLERKHQTVLMHLMEKWVIQDRIESNVDDYGSIANSMDSSRLSLGGTYNQMFYAQQQEQNSLLLKKIDDLEGENDGLIQRNEELKIELEERILRFQDYEQEIKNKDDEIRKLKLSRDSVMISLGLGLHEQNIESVIREKEARIEQLNSLISGIKAQADSENRNLQDEIELLGKKIKQLQKANEQTEFYKEKYQEYNSMFEKCQEVEKKARQFDQALKEKEEQIQMLMGKLQEFKESFQEEKRKVFEKTIEITEKENHLLQLQRENEVLERRYNLQEDKLQDISHTLERIQHEELSILSLDKAPSSTTAGTRDQDKQNQRNGTIEGMKGLNVDLSQIISDLERENNLLKCEANTTNFLDMSSINIEDSSSLKEQLCLMQQKIEDLTREKIDLAAKVQIYQKIDIKKIKEENDKLKGDYSSLLAKSVQLKGQQQKQMDESMMRDVQEQITDKEGLILQTEKENEELRIKVADLLKQIEVYELNSLQFSTRVSQLTAECHKLQTAEQVILKKQESHNQKLEIMFHNKNQELEILFGVLCDLRQRYQLSTKQNKSKAIYT